MQINRLKGNSIKSNGTGSPNGGGSADIGGSRFTIALDYGGLGYRFFNQLAVEPDKVLQVDTINNITETKGSVRTRSAKLAMEMQGRGIGENDIILISSKTHAHQTVAVLATLFLGAIVCPINPELPFKESLELVRKLKPKMCFCDSRTVSQISRILLALNIPSEIVSFGTEVAGTTHFSKLLPFFKEDADFSPFFVANPHKEVAFIVPTQGTSDDPKLVCLSHHNMYLQCLNFMEIFDNPSKVISFFPLSWIAQTILACASLEYGVIRIMAPSFNERTACKIIHDFVIDVAIFGTDLAIKLAGNVAVKDYNLNCLKYVLVGVVNTSKDDLLFMRKALPNVKFLQTYFLTETGLVAAVSHSNYSAALEKPLTVGKLLKNCKIKVLDIESKQFLNPNEVGELYFRGDGLMLGYFKDNTGTIAAIEKGYFKTGDLARYDEDGWIYLEGRIEDMIFYDDSTLIPTEFERCLTSHPHVYDAAVIGNQNELIVCIEKKPDSKLSADKLMTYIIRKMPEHPKSVSGFIFFDEFPRTSAGNVKKRILREEYLKVKIEYTKSLASISPSSPDALRHSTECDHSSSII